MSNVIVAGVGQIPVGEHWSLSLRELAAMVYRQARQDAGGLKPQALFVGNMLAPQLSRQAHVGALLSTHLGLTGIEAVTLEAAGASGGAAIRAGYHAVKSGYVDVALVIGVEKLTDQVGPGVEAALATGTDSDWESVQGMTPTAQAALLMRRYMHQYDVPHEVFAGFSVHAHANAANNPNAMFPRAITMEVYQNASLVSEPLNLFDIAPYADGAAALILTREDLLPESNHHPRIAITGSSSNSDTLALHDRPDPLDFRAARLSVQIACARARINPLQADLFELFDAYSIYAVLSLEAAGFAEKGQGWKLAGTSEIQQDGCMPVSTMGGLKARGNPGGATGVYQAVEAILQLRGQAGANQVPGAARALVQSLSGPASAAITHVFERL
jgi:acetyl-CoA C-acetyltransferase